MRGGLSCVFQPLAYAKTPSLPKYNKDEECSYIMYLDGNSLYPSCVTLALPVDDYARVPLETNPVQQAKRLCREYTDDSEWGYMFFVTMRCPSTYVTISTWPRWPRWR